MLVQQWWREDRNQAGMSIKRRKSDKVTLVGEKVCSSGSYSKVEKEGKGEKE